MTRIKKYKILILALSYIIVYILLILSVLAFDSPLNASAVGLYIMSIFGYLAITLYPINISPKGTFSISDKHRIWRLLAFQVSVTLSVAILTIAFTLAISYGILAMLLLAISQIDSILNLFETLQFSIFIGNIFLSIFLAIHAQINKRKIESLFHLFYFVFVSISPFLLIKFPDSSIRERFTDIIFPTPLLFVLRNYYLWYRRYRQERNNPSKD